MTTMISHANRLRNAVYNHCSGNKCMLSKFNINLRLILTQYKNYAAYSTTGGTSSKLPVDAAPLNDDRVPSMTEQKPNKRLNIPACYPLLTPHQKQSIESLVSLDISRNNVSWVKINRDFVVQDWCETCLFEKPTYAYDHIEYMNTLSAFVKRLPKTDIYVMPKLLHRMRNLQTATSVINSQTVEAVLVTLLNCHKHIEILQSQDSCRNSTVDERDMNVVAKITDQKTSNPLKESSDDMRNDHLYNTRNVVYYMKSSLTAQYFNLCIGGERVSSCDLVHDFITLTSQHSVSKDLSIPCYLSDSFVNMRDRSRQNSMADSLLQAIVFLKYYIHK